MKQLDEMEMMARNVVAIQEKYETMYPSGLTAGELARALLAVMPTIRAALEWRERAYPRARSWVAGSRDTDLVSAIDDLRRRLGGE